MPFCRQTRPSCPAVKAIFSPLWSSHTHTKWRNTQAQQITDDGTNKTTFRSFLKKNDRLCVNLFFEIFFPWGEFHCGLFMIIDSPPVCVCVRRAKREKGGPSITSICWFWVFPGTTSTNGKKKKKKPVVSFGRLYLQGGEGCSSFETFCLEILSLPVVSGSSDQTGTAQQQQDGWSLSSNPVCLLAIQLPDRWATQHAERYKVGVFLKIRNTDR